MNKFVRQRIVETLKGRSLTNRVPISFCLTVDCAIFLLYQSLYLKIKKLQSQKKSEVKALKFLERLETSLNQLEIKLQQTYLQSNESNFDVQELFINCGESSEPFRYSILYIEGVDAVEKITGRKLYGRKYMMKKKIDSIQKLQYNSLLIPNGGFDDDYVFFKIRKLLNIDEFPLIFSCMEGNELFLRLKMSIEAVLDDFDQEETCDFMVWRRNQYERPIWKQRVEQIRKLMEVKRIEYQESRKFVNTLNHKN